MHEKNQQLETQILMLSTGNLAIRNEELRKENDRLRKKVKGRDRQIDEFKEDFAHMNELLKQKAITLQRNNKQSLLQSNEIRDSVEMKTLKK